MQSSGKAVFCFVILAIFLAVFVKETESFPWNKNAFGLVRRSIDEKQSTFRLARSRSDETSDEDSDEGDDEGDAEQAYQALVQQQAQQEAELSREDSGENGSSEDDVYRRRRRDVLSTEKDSMMANKETKTPNEAAPAQEVKPLEIPSPSPGTDEPKKEEAQSEANNAPSVPTEESSPAPASPPSPETSVLISIREALKKVIAEISTQQVAASALEYFQAFEHFIQKTIEQVIDEDDEDESQTINFTTALPETSTDIVEEANKEPESMTEMQDKAKPSETTEDAMKTEKKPEPAEPQPADTIPVAIEQISNTV